MKYLVYLSEIRQRLCSYFLVFALVFGLCFMQANYLYDYLAKPLLDLLAHTPHANTLVAHQITAVFWVPTKLAFIVALILTMPWLLYQGYRFIQPALQSTERQIILNIGMWSLSSFYLGIGFGYFMLCPIALKFFLWVGPAQVFLFPEINDYLNFIVTLTFGAGLGFQGPVIFYYLLKYEYLEHESVRKYRSGIILLIFTGAMFLTPPDVISQILLAIPLWILFESILFCSARRVITKHSESLTDKI